MQKHCEFCNNNLYSYKEKDWNDIAYIICTCPLCKYEKQIELKTKKIIIEIFYINISKNYKVVCNYYTNNMHIYKNDELLFNMRLNDLKLTPVLANDLFEKHMKVSLLK